jgi:hypothetical protein
MLPEVLKEGGACSSVDDRGRAIVEARESTFRYQPSVVPSLG